MDRLIPWGPPPGDPSSARILRGKGGGIDATIKSSTIFHHGTVAFSDASNTTQRQTHKKRDKICSKQAQQGVPKCTVGRHPERGRA